MNLFLIAWRSIQQRGLASALTALSMALGVLLVVIVLAIHGVVSESFNSSSLGYNLIVGANKGGKLQLTLNTVYYLSQPVENIPYDYYLEFTPAAQRATAQRHSIRSQVVATEWDTIDTSGSVPTGFGGLSGLAEAVTHVALRQEAVDRLDHERAGRFSLFTGIAIPVCLGDYFGQFRVVGTTPDMFDKLTYGPAADRHYEFAAGRNFQHWSAEHGYFEAVVGATVAREMHVEVGQEISPAHGDPEGEGHERKFTVVGILKPSGTPNDRAVFINMEGFYLMEDHAKPLPEPEETEPTSNSTEESATSTPAVHSPTTGELEPLPIEQREVTAILVRTANPMVAVSLPTVINEGSVAQCVLPIREIANLFDFIVAPIQKALLGITALVCLVSGISILVSIYNSMSDRRHEIAVMRALGASRGTVMTIILLESILLSVGGGTLGWLSAHAVMALPQVSGYVEEQTGVPIGFTSFAPPVTNLAMPVIGPIMGLVSPELLLVPALLLLAVVVGFIPAMAAYRTDVAKSLGS